MSQTIIFSGFSSLTCAFVSILILASPRLRLSPTAVLLYCWTAGFTLCLVLGNDYNLDLPPAAIILGSLLSAILGAGLSSRLTKTNERQFVVPSSIMCSLPLSLCSSMLLVYAAIKQSQSVSSGVEFLSAEAASAYTTSRYAEDVAMLPISSLAFGFANAITGYNCFSASVQKRRNLSTLIACLSPFIGGVLFTTVTTGRLFTVSIIFYAISGLLLGQAAIWGNQPRLYAVLRPVFYTVSSFVLLATFAIIVQRLRSANKASFADAAIHLRPWASGYIPGFSEWYLKYYSGPTAEPAFFSNLLKGVYSLIGLSRLAGENDAMIYFYDGSSTNALTIFRVLLTDLGALGAVLFFFSFGVFSTVYFLLIAKCPRISILSSFAFYQIALWSVNSYPFLYGSQVIGIFMLACLLFMGDPLRVLVKSTLYLKKPIFQRPRDNNRPNA